MVGEIVVENEGNSLVFSIRLRFNEVEKKIDQ